MRGGGIGGERTRTMQMAWHEQQNCNSFILPGVTPVLLLRPAQPARALATANLPSFCCHLEKQAGAVFCSHLESAF